MSQDKKYEQTAREPKKNYTYPPDFGYCPLSEARVVKLLIQNRSKQDRTIELTIGRDEAEYGVSPFRDEIFCTYYDLDHLIDTCGISDYDKHIIREIMLGYGFVDIADELGIAGKTVGRILDRCVDAIVYGNNENWGNIRRA